MIPFLKAHERLIIAVLLITFLYATASKVLKSWDAHDSRQVAQAQSEANARASQTSHDSQSLAAAEAQASAINAAMSRLIAQNNALLSEIKQKDADLSAQQAATKLGGAATDIGNVSLPLDAARIDAAALDMLPVVQASLTDTQKQLVAETSIVASQAIVITDLNAQIGADGKVCQAEIADLKVKVRRAFLKGFKFGAIAGLIGGVFAGHAL